MENQANRKFRPMPIAELLDGQHYFIIPSFQRGYRWEKRQVSDLLEDIKQFANDDNLGDSYFLQPVVVKWNKDKSAWEVLDGQQRLTTMLLLLKRLVKKLGEDEREIYQNSLYSITYANRPQLDFDNPRAEDNIDSYYLSVARQVIDDWFKDQASKRQNLDSFKGTLLYDQKRQVKIIWYAISENSEDLQSINFFNRLNKGKIPLTNAELIKALFVMDYELHSSENRLAAEQLAMEWNEMEKIFQNDNFWYFISGDNRKTQTRIDILFDFVTCRKETDDTDFSYREFQKLYDFCREKERYQKQEVFQGEWASGINNMQNAWKQVRKTFDRLLAWYESNLYYHYVGYLVAIGFSPLKIHSYLELKKKKKKELQPEYEWTEKDTETALRQLMMTKFKKENKYLTKKDIDDLEYGSEFVQRVLLLMNIECCRRGHCIRFSFDEYKKQEWDIEHVDSRNDATLQEKEDRIRWMNQVKFILELEGTPRSLELANLCKGHIKNFEEKQRVNEKIYNEFYRTINKFYAREADEKEDEVDLTTKKKDFISNLTLLDSSSNREYKDAPFAFKRYYLLNKDKKNECFIPVCTRNLFLKYYSDSNIRATYLDSMRWSSSDREDYLKAIHEFVDPIFDSVSDLSEEEKP
ncbi:MAG: DUF262 domain-containing protein [Lentisphaeria bacterium]|nr:DUF262 domain-containing protein [Lentisphaeria bacterium]